MKRREAEKEMEQRAEAEINKKKAEADQQFLLYQQEKDRKRSQDAHEVAQLHLKQAVSSYQSAQLISMHNFVF